MALLLDHYNLNNSLDDTTISGITQLIVRKELPSNLLMLFLLILFPTYYAIENITVCTK